MLLLIWLFITLNLFLIVFIFMKILETGNRLLKYSELNRRIKVLEIQGKKIEELKKRLKGGKTE